MSSLVLNYDINKKYIKYIFFIHEVKMEDPEELELQEEDDDYEYDDYDSYDYDYDYINFKNNVIHLDNSLIDTISKIEINIVYADVKINLLDYLPWFKKGYTTSESLAEILNLYQQFHNKKLPKIYMCSYYTVNDFSDIVIFDLDYEHELIKSLYDNYLKYEVDENGNIKLESFSSSHFESKNEWIDLLMLSKLGLYLSIMLKYEWVVEELLDQIDPRNYNNEAYHLAVRIGNNKIINMIKNKIIELNWLDKEVLIKEFWKYDFLSADIIKYYQSMKY